MKKFGRDFLETDEESTVELLMDIINHPNVILTTAGESSGETDLDTWEEIDDPDKNMIVNIDRIIEIIDNKSDILVKVCEFCSRLEKAQNLNTVWRCLLEIELKNWSIDRSDKNQVKILDILKTQKMDEKLGLVLCRQYNFQPGLIFILGNKSGSLQNLSDLLFLYLESGMNAEALSLCEKHGKQNPDFWRKILTAWALR